MGPMTIERVRDGEGESGTATQIMANIPLKGREGSLWAPDKPALVKRGEREMTSVVLLWSSRAKQEVAGPASHGASGVQRLAEEHVTVFETASCNALNTHMAPCNNQQDLIRYDHAMSLLRQSLCSQTQALGGVNATEAQVRQTGPASWLKKHCCWRSD